MKNLSGVNELYYYGVLDNMSDDFQGDRDMIENNESPNCIYSSAIRVQSDDILSSLTHMFSDFIQKRVTLMDALGLHPTPVSYTEMSRELHLLFNRALHKSFYSDEYTV
jgi:hypothetical protein